MVLFKRKPVTFLPSPESLADGAEVWAISDTGEVFVEYEKFLNRMDFLNQKKFTDAVNGRSGLTFFDALKSEARSSTAIENVFPEILRDPILRKVQFSTVGRMDDLVNMIYEEFKKDFFPGESVIVVLDSGDALSGVIREKAKFPMIRGPDGSVQREAFSRYFVRLPSSPQDEALVDDKHIRRDRKIFTKQNLRSFLKHSLQREAWTGAPWLVKEHLAIQYRLPMEIPAHLLQDAKLLQNKQNMLQSKQSKSRRSKNFAAEDLPPMAAEDMRVSQQVHRQQQHAGHTQPHANGVHTYHQPATSQVEQKPPPPLIKYPIEDLDVAPKQNGVTRPELKFFTPQMDEFIKKGRKRLPSELSFESLGMLLEIWNTLNVQCEVYVIDSFTFDDFVDAMRFSSTHLECELLNEAFCAVLKQIVSADGKVEIALPKIEQGESEVSEHSQDESELSIAANGPPARSTRSSRLSHVEINTSQPHSPSGSSAKLHRATEALDGFDWQERLAARDMEDGTWQLILVGLLNQLSFAPQFKAKLDRVLADLVPADEEPTKESIQRQFALMDINLRISALQIITMLSVTTRNLKDFLETCSEDQTDVRKRKIEYQRERRLALEELTTKDRERKILLPDNMPRSPEPEIVVASTVEADLDDTLETTAGAGSSDPEDDAVRSLRRHKDRKRKREDEQARAEKEKAEKTALAKAQNKQSREFQKIVKEVERLKERVMDLEAKIIECDADLREANVQRTKVLGKDRFCNRYYWFERNGQPFGGLPTSSTAHYGYANGRIWVQGPDEMEREGYIDLPKDMQAEYKARFRMTVPERRQQEEGSSVLQNANEWGYYDDVDRLDSLIAWLDERGEREKKLYKELKEWRDEMAKYMRARKKFVDDEAAKKVETDEEQATRVSTRHAVQKDRFAAADRCLKWRNSMAIEQQKHLHSQNPPKARGKKKAGDKGVAQIVLTNRSGKPLTRQGGSYSFKS